MVASADVPDKNSILATSPTRMKGSCATYHAVFHVRNECFAEEQVVVAPVVVAPVVVVVLLPYIANSVPPLDALVAALFACLLLIPLLVLLSQSDPVRMQKN